MAKKKNHKVRNKPLYDAMVELRRSNAARPHDPRPNRQRTRRDQLRAALADYK